MAGAYQNGQLPKPAGVMGFHLGGGDVCRFLQNFTELGTRMFIFWEKIMVVGVANCRAASGGILKFGM